MSFNGIVRRRSDLACIQKAMHSQEASVIMPRPARYVYIIIIRGSMGRRVDDVS